MKSAPHSEISYHPQQVMVLPFPKHLFYIISPGQEITVCNNPGSFTHVNDRNAPTMMVYNMSTGVFKWQSSYKEFSGYSNYNNSGKLYPDNQDESMIAGCQLFSENFHYGTKRLLAGYTDRAVPEMLFSVFNREGDFL